jgi:transposase
MAWKAMDVDEQRVRFVVAASRREKPLGALCAEFGISRPTGSLWIKRYGEAGLAGIVERSRRPRTFPAQTPWAQEERVIALRLRYPDWGARKLEVVLARDGVKLTRSTIHRILLRYELIHDADRHPQAVKRFERERPNELWQMDFQGAEELAARHRPAVGDRRPQPLSGRVERDRQAGRRPRPRAVGADL